MQNIKKGIKWLIFSTMLYLGIFTWNAKSGYLDKISNNIGLNIAGLILYPANIVTTKIKNIWKSYIYLVNTQKENDQLKKEIAKLKIEITRLEIKAREWERLRKLLKFNPIPNWSFIGGRVIYHKLGPAGIFNSIVIDCGSINGVKKDLAVVTPEGLIGRIFDVSLMFSQVLLITDENSKVPVISQKHRTLGILEGRGTTDFMEVKYVPRTASVEVGEIFVTSGLGGVFPKGIPVGKIIKIEYSNSSFFQKILVKPLVNTKTLEEILVLKPNKQIDINSSYIPRTNH